MDKHHLIAPKSENPAPSCQSEKTEGMKSLDAWIKHREGIRRYNMISFGFLIAGNAALAIFVSLKVAALVALLSGVVAVLLLGMGNVCLLLSSPAISATEAEILERAANGPPWFKKLVTKLS